MVKDAHTCSRCDSAFASVSARNRHVRVVHEKRRDHACPHCATAFDQASHLKQHVRAVHEKRRDHACPHCAAAFGQARNLTTHVRTVHEKRRDHACPHCTAAFGKASDLTRHVRSAHLAPHCAALVQGYTGVLAPPRARAAVRHGRGGEDEEMAPAADAEAAAEADAPAAEAAAAEDGAAEEAPTPVSAPTKKQLRSLVQRLMDADDKGLFSVPVPVDVVPDYLDVIKNPMDLGTMKKKVNAGDYAEGGVEAMAQDFEQIISNCRTYNKPDTPYVKLAGDLLTTGTAIIEAFKTSPDAPLRR